MLGRLPLCTAHIADRVLTWHGYIVNRPSRPVPLTGQKPPKYLARGDCPERRSKASACLYGLVETTAVLPFVHVVGSRSS
jgi:hypothetical protein